MPTIKPVSDLRNYGDVLRDVAVGRPVFLTRNGHGRYAILDIEEYQEYECLKAMRQFIHNLGKERPPERKEDRMSLEEIMREFEKTYGKEDASADVGAETV